MSQAAPARSPVPLGVQPPVERETIREFLDSLADNVLIDPSQRTYRKDGSRREVTLGRGLVLRLDEQPSTRLGSNVSLPGAAGAPGRLIGLDVLRERWSGGLYYQRSSGLHDSGGQFSLPLGERFSLRAGVRDQRSELLGERRRDDELALRYSGSGWWSDVGLHRAALSPRGDEPALPAERIDADANLLRARASWQPTPTLSLRAEAERALGSHDRDDPVFRDRFELGADLQLPGALLYWREAPRLGLLSHGEALDLRAAYRRTLGIEVPDGSPDGVVYSQWRQHSLSDTDDALWIVGWRHGFDLGQRWLLQSHVEQATPTAGRTAQRSFTVGGRLWHGAFPDHSFVTEVERVDAEDRESAYGAVKHTWRLSRNSLGAVRLSASRSRARIAEREGTNERKLSAAWGWREPEERRVSVLARYTFAARETDELDSSDRRAHILAGQINRRLAGGDELIARTSRRWERDDLRPELRPRVTDLWLLRGVHELGGRWSLSAHLTQRRDPVDGVQTGFGVELGARLSSKAVLALGYNPRGFSDRELSVDETPRQGLTLRLRFSIDAVLGRWLDEPPR